MPVKVFYTFFHMGIFLEGDRNMGFTMKDRWDNSFGFWVLGFELMVYHEGHEGLEGYRS